MYTIIYRGEYYNCNRNKVWTRWLDYVTNISSKAEAEEMLTSLIEDEKKWQEAGSELKKEYKLKEN